MSRALVGGLLGGGAATVYLRPDLVVDFAKDKALQGLLSGRNISSIAGNSQQLDELTRLVDQLRWEVANSKHQLPVTIAMPGSASRTSSIVFYTLVVGGLGTVVYLKMARGWGLTDFLYVTRRSLRVGLEQVGKGLEEVRGRLDNVKAALQEKIGVLMRKQDATIATQREMQSKLNVVGEDVDNIRGQVGEIRGLVLDVTSGLSEVGSNQRHANQGIFILCKAVSELMQGSNIPSKKELIEYTQHPIWTADKLQGLESILCDITDNAQQRRGGGGMLLEAGSNGACRALSQAGEPVGMWAGVDGSSNSFAFGSVGSSSGGEGPLGSSNGIVYAGSGGTTGGGFGGIGGEMRGPRLQHSSSFGFGGVQQAPSAGRASPSFGTGVSVGGGIIASRVVGRPVVATDSFADPW